MYNGSKTKFCLKCKNKKTQYIDYLISELNNKEYKIKHLNKLLDIKKELKNIPDIYPKQKSVNVVSISSQTDFDYELKLDEDNFECENEIKNNFNILEYLKNLKH